MLGYKPRQEGVNISTPTSEAEAGCKVDLVKGQRKGSGWQLKDDKGNVLRLFFDSNEDNKIDVWAYYKDGVEVYREIDYDVQRQARPVSLAECRRHANGASMKPRTAASRAGRLSRRKRSARKSSPPSPEGIWPGSRR